MAKSIRRYLKLSPRSLSLGARLKIEPLHTTQLPEDALSANFLAFKKTRVRFRFVFWRYFIFNKIAGFVFGFVFSTGTCFQQFPGFVLGLFGFVFVVRFLVINNFPASFFKKGILFYFICLISPRKITARRHCKKTTMLAHKSQAKSRAMSLPESFPQGIPRSGTSF
jgi:hypothetical protein